MQLGRNIGASFLEKAQQVPKKIAIMDEGNHLTFEQLAGLVVNFAMHFQSHSVARGSTVGIRSDDPTVIVASALSASLLGCRWAHAGKALLAGGAVEVSHFFETEMEKEPPIKNAVRIDASWAQPPAGFEALKTPVFPGARSEDDAWLIFPSSGTTGTPKYMVLSHRIVADRITANAAEFSGASSNCVFLFPQHTPPSLMRSIAALLSGWGLVHSGSPKFWSEAGVSHVFASPVQIRQVMSGVKLPRKLGKALIGGDGMSDALARDLLEHFGVVVNTYGSTEANLIIENAKTIGFNGKVETRTIWHDSKLEIVDGDDQPLAGGTEGIVRVRNGYLVKGYLDSRQAEAAAFRDGWFYPGDRGILTDDGQFTVVGRVNDQLNVGGTKVNAVLLDFMLQTVPGVEDAICFMMPEPDGQSTLIAFLKISTKAVQPDVVTEARVRISANAGIDAVPSRFLFTDVIPRNENGKPDRVACVRLALAARAARGGKGV